MNIFQDILIYITCFLMFLVTWKGFWGASRIKVFEQKQWRMLRLISLLTYINFGFALAEDLRIAFSEAGYVLQVEVMLLFFVVVWVGLGMAKIRNTLIHGKKFAAMFFYFGIALAAMLLLTGYLRWWNYASTFF